MVGDHAMRRVGGVGVAGPRDYRRLTRADRDDVTAPAASSIP